MSHRTHILTVEEVRQYDREIGTAGPLRPGEHRANVSPYRETLDARNFWTSIQDTKSAELPELPPEGGGLPDVPPVTLDPTGRTHTAPGGNGSIQVTVTGEGVSGTWTVDKQSEATWLHVLVPTEPQVASGGISYSVDPNSTGQSRVGQLYVNGKTFTATQEP